MELKEAKGRLQHLYKENKNTLAVFSTTSKVREDYLKENEAIETILQELDNLQKENESIKARVDKYIQGVDETLRLEHEETLKYYETLEELFGE